MLLLENKMECHRVLKAMLMNLKFLNHSVLSCKTVSDQWVTP